MWVGKLTLLSFMEAIMSVMNGDIVNFMANQSFIDQWVNKNVSYLYPATKINLLPTNIHHYMQKRQCNIQ